MAHRSTFDVECVQGLYNVIGSRGRTAIGQLIQWGMVGSGSGQILTESAGRPRCLAGGSNRHGPVKRDGPVWGPH